MSTRMYDKPSQIHSILNSRILVNKMQNEYIFFQDKTIQVIVIGSCLGKIFISLNTLEKSGYAVSRYAITPLRGLLTTETIFVWKCLATVYASFSWLQNSFEKYLYIFLLNWFLESYKNHRQILCTLLLKKGFSPTRLSIIYIIKV